MNEMWRLVRRVVRRSHGGFGSLVVGLLLFSVLALPGTSWAQPGNDAGEAPVAKTVDPEAARARIAAQAPRLEAYVRSFRYRDATLAAGLVRHKLSPRGTLEVQPSANTLVVRDIPSILERIKPILADFDRPPAKVRLELRVVKAGPRPVVSPPQAGPAAREMPPALLEKLQSLLRYDNYEVLAEAAVSSLEGEAVDYSLGPDYSVSFTVGSLMAQRRLRVEDFRIVERLSSDKGRGLDPKQLFQADLNLWMDRRSRWS